MAAVLEHEFSPAASAKDEDTDEVPVVPAVVGSAVPVGANGASGANGGVGVGGGNGSMPDTPIALSCEKVEVSYGPVQILFGIDLDVHEGEIVALLGTNGAGKSTLLKGASGLVKVGGGSVRLGGVSIDGDQAESIARKGLSLMPGVVASSRP